MLDDCCNFIDASIRGRGRESPSLPPIPINQSRFPLQSSSTGSCLVHSFPLTKPTNPSSTDKGIAINSIHFQRKCAQRVFEIFFLHSENTRNQLALKILRKFSRIRSRFLNYGIYIVIFYKYTRSIDFVTGKYNREKRSM